MVRPRRAIESYDRRGNFRAKLGSGVKEGQRGVRFRPVSRIQIPLATLHRTAKNESEDLRWIFMPNQHASSDTPDPSPQAESTASRLDIPPTFHSELELGMAAAFGGRTGGVRPPDRLGTTVLPGSIIADKYKLIEQIGEGGMGTVWYAEQFVPLKRKVAIKLIKPGMDSRSVMARFDAERQALALMDHPNIAKVLDGGMTDRERPFFAMELVRGTAITTFCDQRKLDLHERLQLFIPVCQAIQHAHQKGIIHRDIKPSNVLVALYDDKPVPKVIDFGVAKAAGTTLTDQSLHTGFGSVVGTAEYMSPEQAHLNNVDIDTRSDVYSLGVLLYELLAGSPPFRRAELAERGAWEILRVVREVDPPLPSMKLSTSKTRASIAAVRNTDPVALGKLLRSDLDWIVMKTLEKDRARRYETAIGLSRDLERFLRDEPVEACPPSAGYKMRKFIRRNRPRVLAAALLLLTLVGGIIGTTMGLYRAEGARRVAVAAQQAEAERAEGERRAKLDALAQKEIAERAERETLESYRASTADTIEHLIGAQPALGPHERKYLEDALHRWQVFADRQGDDERSRAIRGEGHFRVGQIWKSLGQSAEAKTEFEQATGIWAKLVADFPRTPEYRSSSAGCIHSLGQLLASLGETKAAEDQLRLALSHRAALAAEFPAVSEYRESLARNHESLGNLQRGMEHDRAALEEYRAALAIRQTLVEEFPAEPEFRMELAASHTNLAILLRHLGIRSEAEEHYRSGLAVFEQLCVELPGHPLNRQRTATCQRGLGLLLFELGQYEEAEQLFRKGATVLKSLASEFPSVPEYQSDLASNHQSLGRVLMAFDRHAEAEQHFLEALKIDQRTAEQFPTLPEYQDHLGNAHANLAVLMNALEKTDRAESHFRSAVAIQEDLARQYPLVPGYRDRLATSVNSLAILLGDHGKTAEAVVEHRKALSIREQLAADFPSIPGFAVELGGSFCNMGILERDGGDPAKSMVWFDKAIATLLPIFKADNRSERVREYLRNSYLGRANAQLLLKNFSQTDWDRTVELSSAMRQPHYRLKRAMARMRTGDLDGAVADVIPLMPFAESLSENSPWSTEDWYDLGCVFAAASGVTNSPQTDYAERAMKMLTQAVQAGYDNADNLRTNVELDTVRARDDFKALLEQLESAPTHTPD